MTLLLLIQAGVSPDLQITPALLGIGAGVVSGAMGYGFGVATLKGRLDANEKAFGSVSADIKRIDGAVGEIAVSVARIEGELAGARNRRADD